jgi:hypothetical protein
MTAASSSRSLTVSDLLFGSPQDSEAALTEVLREQGVLSSLDAGLGSISAVGRKAAYSEVASAVRELLDLVLQPEFVIFTVRWPVGGSGRHGRGPGGGVAIRTSAAGGRCR